MLTEQYSAQSAQLSVRLPKWAWPKIARCQINLTQSALPPQTDGSIVFARWPHRVLPWGHLGATWRIRLNLCILRRTGGDTTQMANRSVQRFLHSSRQKVP